MADIKDTNFKRRVRSERRTPPDLRKLSRALIALAQAQADADARAEHEARLKDEQERRKAS